MIYNDRLQHHGIKGQRWGVRRFQNEDGSLTKEGKQERRRNLGKTIGTASIGIAAGAAAVGAAWYLRNRHNANILRQKRVAAAAKANATKAARRASGAYQTFKNVDVLVSQGSEFIKQFSNVKLAKILT